MCRPSTSSGFAARYNMEQIMAEKIKDVTPPTGLNRLHVSPAYLVLQTPYRLAVG